MKAKIIIYDTYDKSETELSICGMNADDLDAQYVALEESLKYTEKVIKEYYYI
jgi:hypothetical protein